MRTSLSNTIRRVSLESDEMQQDVELPLEAPVAETQGPEEWIVDTHQPLDEVRDSATLSDQLEDLTEVVEDAPLEASVESYHWMLNTLIQNAGMPTTRGVALENFTHSSGGKKLLASSIRNYNGNLKRSINVALENYTDGYAKVVSDNIDQYKGLAVSLAKSIDDFEESAVLLEVSTKKIFRMFHVNNEFLKVNSDIGEESKRISKIIENVTSKIKTLSAKPSSKVTLNSSTTELMFNRQFVTSVEGASFKEHGDVGRMAPINKGYIAGAAAAGVLIGGISGAALGPVVATATAVVGGVVNTTLAAGVSKITALISTVNPRSKNSFIKSVEELTKLNADVKALDSSLSKLADAISKLDSVEAAEAKHTAAPLIEAAGLIVKHLNELLVGFTKVFAKVIHPGTGSNSVNASGKNTGELAKGFFSGRLNKAY